MPDKTILAKLRSTEAVTNECGAAASIRPGTLRESDTLPGIIVTRVAHQPVNSAGGTTGTKFATVEVQCIATDYAAARNLVDAVETALNGYTNVGGSPAVSMVHVQDITYAPGPAIRGQDKQYEQFIAMCFVQFS